MSLLNDMLRDLSHQQKTAEAVTNNTPIAPDLTVHEQRELFNQSSVVKPLSRSVVPSVVVFVMVLGAVLGWQHWDSENSKTHIADHISVDPVLVQIKTPEVITEIAAAPVTEKNPQPVLSVESFVNSPAAVEFTNPELIVRLAALESAVTNLAGVVTDNNASTKMATDQTNADSVEPVEVASVSVKDPFDVQENVESSRAVDVRIAEPQENTNPVVQKLSNEPAHLSIAPNPRSQDQKNAHEARELVAQGQLVVALEQLQNFIANAQQPRESVKALLDILSDQGDVQQMNAVLAQADFLSASEQAYYGAKKFVLQQDDHQAIQLLETNLIDASADENYRALLAGLYQKNGQSVEAANHYRRLLSVFGDKPAYWLGFALAQDALNQPKVALQAYQRVNQYPELQLQVRSYIQQRIAALQQ